jgi:hypothetical protein
MLSYSFYGKKAVGYLFGNSTTAERIYNALFLNHGATVFSAWAVICTPSAPLFR